MRAGGLGRAKTKTTVTIDAVFLASGQTHWSGDVTSARKACKDKRRVLIYRARPGADRRWARRSRPRVGEQRLLLGTHFKVGAAPSGKYYAKVKPTDKCQGGQSKTLKGPT